MLGDDDEEDSTPPKRSKRFTISYAQATKRLSFNNESILTPPKTVQAYPTTAMTTTSTLTQESLEESLRRFRIETDNSIETFRNEIQDKFMNMEDLIVAVVTKAVRIPTPEINTQCAPNDTNSNYSTAQDSNYTTSSLTDKVDNLTEIVLLLTKDLKELKADRERESSKRIRSPFPTPPKTNTQKEDDDSPNKSPPPKQQRSRSDSITIPPRHPIQKLTEEGAMEET
jgi:hypothetical protein